MFNFKDKHDEGRYLAVLLVTSVSLLFVIFSFTWILDPLGILKQNRAFPSICENGVKVKNDRTAIAFLASSAEADEIIIGTSRIKRGFTKEIAAADLPDSIINLSFGGMRMEEMYQLIWPRIKDSVVKKIWIALDYGMFVNQWREFEKLTLITNNKDKVLYAYRDGLLSFNALKASLFSLLSEYGCNKISRNIKGFLSNTGDWQPPVSETARKLQEQLLVARFSNTHGKTEQHYQERMNMLYSLVHESLKQKINVNLFINPSHSNYVKSIHVAGVAEKFERWKTEVKHMVKNLPENSGIEFRDFSQSNMLASDLSSFCTTDSNSVCSFYDNTHYTPQIAREIILAFASK